MSAGGHQHRVPWRLDGACGRKEAQRMGVFAFAQLIRIFQAPTPCGSCRRTLGLLRGLSQGGYVMALYPAGGEALAHVRMLAGDA